MGLERYNDQHGMAVVDTYHDPIASFTMNTRNYVTRPTVVTAAITCTLPPVSEAKGRFYTVFAMGAVTNALPVTIQDNNDDSEGWPIDIVLNEAGRGAVFYSDGRKWHYGEKHFTSSLIAGAVNLDEVHLTMDTDGAQTTDVFIARLTAPVIVGNSAGAIFAQVDFSDADARVQGLGYAVCAEMKLPNNAAIASGHYTCIDFEMSAGATTNWGGGTKVSYMRFDDWGGEVNFAASAFFFTLAGVRLTGNLISLTAVTLKVLIETDIDKTRYLVMSETEDVINIGNDVDYEMISAVYQLGLYSNISSTHANLADGWFVQDWHSLIIEDGTDFTATAQVFCLHTYLNWAGAGSWAGSGSCSPIVGHYSTVGANAVVVSHGYHAGITAVLALGSGFDLASPAEAAGIIVSCAVDGAAAFTYGSYSGMMFVKSGGLAYNSAIKVIGASADHLFCLFTDAGMVTDAGAVTGVSVDTVKIKCLIDGNTYYLLATTTPA